MSENERSNAARRTEWLSHKSEGQENAERGADILSDQHVREALNKFEIKMLNCIWADSIYNRALFNHTTDTLHYIFGLLEGIKDCQRSLPWDNAFTSLTFGEVPPVKPYKRQHENFPKKPNIDQIIHRYKEWYPPFSNYHKKRFDLSSDELNEFIAVELAKWELDRDRIIESNKEIDLDNRASAQMFDISNEKYMERRQAFENRRQGYINCVQHEKQLYLSHNADAIADYVQLILRKALYPASFPYEVQLYYSEGKTMIADYLMPSMEDLPKLKENRFLKTKNEHKPVYFKEAELSKIYDEALFKIVLRTLYIIFNSDEANAIDSVTFNGWVKYTNKATGNKETSCILSVQCRKNEFVKIAIDKVDPKMCFRSLKGVGSTKLYSMTPIRPILQLNRQDRRFVSPITVEEALGNIVNIAAMPWEEFEHLIRGIFEKEFTKDGCEVKITRASRDGGVDAVAFDPDPIRGGKIVIQAKRYTNTVGVSAVRDLYGTVINEGANKGILVSTADYGPEAYAFAKDKPLTLLNGGNLLHLLNKHGYKAKIDLKEAKQMLLESQRDS